MSELREDGLTGRRVLIAAARAARPLQFAPSATPDSSACPFCAGREHETPTAVRVYPTTGDWRIRIVPNKFPAVAPLAPATSACDEPAEWSGTSDAPPAFASHPGRGVHEVVIESREHVVEFADLPPPLAALGLRAFRDRCADLGADPRLRHVQVFKNNGAAAGASLAHVHSQILATDFVPCDVFEELRRARRWSDERRECLACRALADELADGRRIVAVDERFVAYCPYASGAPFQMRITPRRHLSRFDRCDDDDLDALARILLDALRRLRGVLGDVAYNLALASAPIGEEGPSVHWRWDLVPRATLYGGYELSSGVLINVTPPEVAASLLAGA